MTNADVQHLTKKINGFCAQVKKDFEKSRLDYQTLLERYQNSKKAEDRLSKILKERTGELEHLKAEQSTQQLKIQGLEAQIQEGLELKDKNGITQEVTGLKQQLKKVNALNTLKVASLEAEYNSKLVELERKHREEIANARTEKTTKLMDGIELSLSTKIREHFKKAIDEIEDRSRKTIAKNQAEISKLNQEIVKQKAERELLEKNHTGTLEGFTQKMKQCTESATRIKKSTEKSRVAMIKQLVTLLSIVAPGMEKSFQKDNFSVDQLVETLRISLTTLMNVTKNAERMFGPAMNNMNQILPSKPEEQAKDIPKKSQNNDKKITNTESKKPNQPKEGNSPLEEMIDLVNNVSTDSMEVEKPPSPIPISPIPPSPEQETNDLSIFGSQNPTENSKKRKYKAESENLDPRPKKHVKIPGFTDNSNGSRAMPPAEPVVVKEEPVLRKLPSLPTSPKKKPAIDKRRHKVIALKRIQSKVCAAEVEVQVEHAGNELPDAINFRAQLSVNPCMDYIYKWIKKARKNIKVFPIRMDEEDPGWLAFRTHYLLRQTVGHCQMVVKGETHIFFLIPAFEQFLQYASDKLNLTLDPVSSHMLRIRIMKKNDKKPAARRDQAERRQASDDEKKREGTKPRAVDDRNRKHRSHRQSIPQKPVFKRTDDWGNNDYGKGKKKSLPRIANRVKFNSKPEVILLDL